MPEIVGALNSNAGTVGREFSGAASAYAGNTAALEGVGALNALAGTVGLELEGVLNVLAGTAGLGSAYAAEVAARNLLTTNQATVETDTTGLAFNSNCSIARSTAQYRSGIASMSMTVTASAAATIAGTVGGLSGVPVIAGTSYTAMLSHRPPTSGQVSVRIYWYKSNGTASTTANTSSAAFSTTANTWKDWLLTAVAPADAAYANVQCYIYSGSSTAGAVHYVDQFGLFRGTRLVWAAP